MPLDLRDCTFFGPALPEPFVRYQLEGHLKKRGLLPGIAGPDGKELVERWESYRRSLRLLAEGAGPVAVFNRVIAPLAERLGYSAIEREAQVETREGKEDGGYVLLAPGGQRLRAWAVARGTDLDAPSRRGRAYRFSPGRIAQRVLLGKGERLALLSDGDELRLVICDPARPESFLGFSLGRAGGWRRPGGVPDSYRLLLALASPAGSEAIAELTEEARLAQTTVTSKLRQQAREAVEGFVQHLLDDPRNRERLAEIAAQRDLARALWDEGLILVYRLLFVLKLEASPNPARAFSFSSTTLWRNVYSPTTALARVVREVLDRGAETGEFLAGGLRAMFRLFSEGLSSSEIKVSPLGGMLFGKDALPVLEGLVWPELAVATLLDRLLWTPGTARAERERVHYGSLDVEDLGRVYEALLELEPGIAQEPMCRLRRDKLEVVLPLAQGERYRETGASPLPAGSEDEPIGQDADPGDEGEDEAEDANGAGRRKGGTRVAWMGEIPAGRFYLRLGLGRKATGSYYTPHPFVRFLVAETLGPQVAEASSADDPQPAALLKLKVLDPAMGSGHFLVEACRYLGEKLYEACRLCDELASAAQASAESCDDPEERAAFQVRATALWNRIEALPDGDTLFSYLPSRSAEGEDSGLSLRRAEALCRRLVAAVCLYGVDKNPLAVELAKLSLWLESHAEGLPLTFMDHRLVCGDSLTGPFFEDLLTLPGSGKPLDDLFAAGLEARLRDRLTRALGHVAELNATVGKDLNDLVTKTEAKARLDAELEPFKLLAAVWSGGVRLGPGLCDDEAYRRLVRAIADGEDFLALVPGWRRDGGRATGPGAADPAPQAAGTGSDDALGRMLAAGRDALAYDLVFPEVFRPEGSRARTGGFAAVLGNPPWDALQPLAKEFFASYDLRVLDAPTRRERSEVEKRLIADPAIQAAYEAYNGRIQGAKRLVDRIYRHVGRQAGGQPSGAVTDLWQAFAERGFYLLARTGRVGWVLPSAFHANQSATGIRELYLNEGALVCCFSFENRKKLFDIDSRFKFAAVAAQRQPRAEASFPCAFYLHDLDWLFREAREVLPYSAEFVRRTGGEYWSFLELRSASDAEIAMACYQTGQTFGGLCEQWGIRCGEEMHMSKSSHRFTPSGQVLPPGADPRDPDVAARTRARGYLPLHEGKTFHQFDDRWEDPPRYLVALEAIADKPAWLGAATHYRLAFRDIARSTDERTGLFCLLPPGVVFANTAPCERAPGVRPSSRALALAALANTFAFDWTVRQKSAAHVNLFILNGCPVPALPAGDAAIMRFLVHGALRLSCNHAGYEPLWREQVGESWREARPPFTWPVLEGDDARWEVRAAIDAVVAQAWGLDRDQYERVLASFNHRSYPEAPARCLAAFDELEALGAEAFMRHHDPYHDSPLVQALPEAVIDPPVAAPVGKASPPGGQLTILG